MALKLVSTFPDRLKLALANFTITDFAQSVGVSKQTISAYTTGARKPKAPTIRVIADVLGVNPAWLLGYEVEKYELETKKSFSDSDIISDINENKIPVLDAVISSQIVFTDEQVSFYLSDSSNMHIDICYKVLDDSMINARIQVGDLVFIHKQTDVNDGEIALVVIENETMLKRVYKGENEIVLMSENPNFKPLIYKNADRNSIIIIGKAIAFQSNIPNQADCFNPQGVSRGKTS